LAHVVSNVWASPRAVSYGLVSLGAAVDREVVLSSRSGEPLELLDVQVPEGLEVQAEPCAERERSLTVRLTARPSQPGQQCGLVRFVLRGAGGQRHELEMRTSLEAREPAATEGGFQTEVSN
jgi:hypothetical protein